MTGTASLGVCKRYLDGKFKGSGEGRREGGWFWGGWPTNPNSCPASCCGFYVTSQGAWGAGTGQAGELVSQWGRLDFWAWCSSSSASSVLCFYFQSIHNCCSFLSLFLSLWSPAETTHATAAQFGLVWASSWNLSLSLSSRMLRRGMVGFVFIFENLCVYVCVFFFCSWEKKFFTSGT
jgi:hypothetical protein